MTSTLINNQTINHHQTHWYCYRIIQPSTIP